MSRKTIVISEDGMFASEPLTFADVLQLTCSCVAGVAGSVLAKAQDADEAKKIEGELFDIANVAFSNCLEHTFPTMSLHPDLTEEAILKAENEILADRAAEMEDFLADSEPQVGAPEKIIPFPAGKACGPEDTVLPTNERTEPTGSPEPAGTYDPNESACCSGNAGEPMEGGAE